MVRLRLAWLLALTLWFVAAGACLARALFGAQIAMAKPICDSEYGWVFSLSLSFVQAASFEDRDFPAGKGIIGDEAWNGTHGEHAHVHPNELMNHSRTPAPGHTRLRLPARAILETGGKIKFMRPPEFSEHFTFLKDGVEPGDIVQGALGDCWFLGALSVLGSRPDLLSRVLPADLGASGARTGKYVFRLFKFGEWHEVTIDDRVPVGAQGPIFATSHDHDEVWVELLEKAYAKLHRTYSALIGGWVTDALVDMTGGVPQTIMFDEIRPDIESGAFWTSLLGRFASGEYLMGCACSTAGKRETDTGTGILAGHAYGILRVVECRGHRLICCRNPWGSQFVLGEGGREGGVGSCCVCCKLMTR